MWEHEPTGSFFLTYSRSQHYNEIEPRLTCFAVVQVKKWDNFSLISLRSVIDVLLISVDL